MKRWETIRGHGEVDHLFARGRRLDAGTLRCMYIVTDEPPFTVRVVFAVSSRLFTAVKRNRIKRLMREAFRREFPALQSALLRERQSAVLLFVFRGAKGLRVQSLRLDEVWRNMAAVCGRLRATLER